MSDEQNEKPELEIHSDEDWKEKVKSEDAALDKQIETEKTAEIPLPESEKPQPEETSQPEEKEEKQSIPPLPKATFESLVGMYSTQAMVALGAIPNPISGKAEPELHLAKHFIDLLGIIEEKTKGNLTSDEEKLLSATLHHLRVGYVEITKEA